MTTAIRILTLPARLPLGARAMRYATLTSVGALVLSVSLSLFGDLALRENERDALRTLGLLGEAWAADGSGASLREVLGSDPLLERRLRDRRWISEGRLLLHHGYVFAQEPASGELRAWPWRWSRTGVSAFAWSDGTLWSHPNGDGRWSGAAPASRPGSSSSDWVPQD